MILIKPDAADDKTSGGIWIPGAAQEQPLRGEIVAVGKGLYSENGHWQPMSVSVGQKVYYTKNYTTEVMHKNSEHLLMDERRVLLIID